MYVVLHFKDGVSIRSSDLDPFSKQGEGDLMQLLKLGRQNDWPIVVASATLPDGTTTSIERKHSELRSIEIVLE